MPGMSGAEFAKRIASRNPSIKVLFMSGYIDDSVLRQGIQENEAAFLEKPFTPISLAKKSAGSLGRRGGALKTASATARLRGAGAPEMRKFTLQPQWRQLDGSALEQHARRWPGGSRH